MSAKSKVFAREIFDSAKKTDIDPLFVTAHTCIETGWGRTLIGNYNLFGVKADVSWEGERILVRTTEVLDEKIKLQTGESVLSSTVLKTGRTKYVCRRWFKEYDSLSDALKDRFSFLDKNEFRHDRYILPLRLQQMGNMPCVKYAETIQLAYKTLLKLGIK